MLPDSSARWKNDALPMIRLVIMRPPTVTVIEAPCAGFAFVVGLMAFVSSKRLEDLGGVVRDGPRLGGIRLNARLAEGGEVVAADLFVLGHRVCAGRTESLRLASPTKPETRANARCLDCCPSLPPTIWKGRAGEEHQPKDQSTSRATSAISPLRWCRIRAATSWPSWRDGDGLGLVVRQRVHVLGGLPERTDGLRDGLRSTSGRSFRQPQAGHVRPRQETSAWETVHAARPQAPVWTRAEQDPCSLRPNSRASTVVSISSVMAAAARACASDSDARLDIGDNSSGRPNRRCGCGQKRLEGGLRATVGTP